MVFTSLKRKLGRKFSFKYKNRRGITVKLNLNSSETNHLNTSDSDDVKVNLNLPCIDVHTKISLNKLINLQKETDTQSSTSINDEITDENYTSE